MTAFFDIDHALCRDLRLHVMISLCHISKGRKYIQPGNSLGCLLDSLHVVSQRVPDLTEQLIFK